MFRYFISCIIMSRIKLSRPGVEDASTRIRTGLIHCERGKPLDRQALLQLPDGLQVFNALSIQVALAGFSWASGRDPQQYKAAKGC